MKAVIMAGGFGTRLRPITCNLPKPMVPVVNKPMMYHIVNLLKKHNLTDIVSILYHQADKIMSYFQDGSRFGIKMNYAGADDDYGTAGAVKMAHDFLKNDRFLIISGDVLTDFDLTSAIKFHESKKAKVTIVLTRVSNPLEYGVVITDEEGRIKKFLEKPSWGEVFSDTVNTGIYIIEPEVLDYIPYKKNFDFSKDLFPLLLEKGEPIYGYIAPGYWKDIGNIDEYRYAHYDILNGNVRVEIPGKRLDLMGRDVFLGNNVELGENIDWRGGVIIGNNVKIGSQVKLHNVIIGDNCVIEDGANIEGAIIWAGTIVKQGATIKESIIGFNCEIGKKSYIAERVVISDEVIIGDEATVKSNVKIWPSKKVEDGALLSHSLIWGEKWSRNLFGRYGINGLANVEITPEFATKLGAVFGATLGKSSIVATSRDADKTSRLINRAIISGLLSVGVNVYDLRVTPLPVVRYFIRSQGLAGGIHTSLDNPRELLLRFLDNKGSDLPVNKQKSIERLFFREDFVRAKPEEVGELSFPHRVVEYYREGLINSLNVEVIRQTRPKISVDYSYGPVASIFPNILSNLGVEVISLNSYVAETLPIGIKNKSNCEELAKIVQSTDSNFGIVFDQSGEIVKLILDNGKILNEIDTLAIATYLMSRYAKTDNRNKIVLPVYAPTILDKIAGHFGVEIIRTKTSQSVLMSHANDENVLMVADLEGRFIIPQIQTAFDSMAFVAKLIELATLHDQTLSQLLEELPKYFFTHQTIHCNWDKKGTVMRKLIEFSKDKEAVMIDGVKIIEDNGWVLMLPDNEKPIFHLWVEAENEENLNKLTEKYMELVKQWREN